MNNDTLDFIPSLPVHLRERTRALNAPPVKRNGAFVLYWMHHAARGHHNPALDAAIFTANRLNLPVLVYQGLGGRHPYNSDRHHTFILEGAREVQRELTERGIAYCFHLPTDPATATPLKALMDRAALTITEDFPAPPFNAWSRRLARASSSTFWVVDTACLLPLQSMAVYHARAYQFRDAARPEYKKRTVQPYHDLQSTTGIFQGQLGFDGLDLASADIAELCARCRIDHTVGQVAHTRGGASSGYRRWEVFKQHGLARYADMRNDAAVAFPLGVSRMSAYLHHGHVSPFRIARQAALAGGPGAKKFLDELLIWRELAHHFCFHHPAPGAFGALPAWAQKTLDDHRKDRREAIFDWETLSRGRTGDPLWDAAQRSLMIHGELHNNVRMTWGKAILQWTRSPEEALQTIIDLNHRYALDGSDPNSYGGILWCMGLFDRAFHPEKPVIGILRPRSTRSHARRLRLDAYTARTARPASRHRFRINVVGAGISGLIAARTLADHGHAVTVFEKGRGTGGRMSTRRSDGMAFDHGAQYFTARDEVFRQWVDRWMASGVVRPWKGRIRVLRDGQLSRERRPHRRYVGIPGMSALSARLADGLDLRLRSRVHAVRREAGTIALTDDQDRPLGSCDALIVTAPPEQSTAIVRHATPLADRSAAVRMNPCWAVLMAFDPPLTLPYDGLFIHGADIVWAARNSSKPGRPTADCWVVHAGAAWSKTHLELDADAITDRLMASFFKTVGLKKVAPLSASAHRWRYAQAATPLTAGCLWDHRARIGICGDWCFNSRIEGAFLSGAAMAGRILSHIAAAG